MYHFSVETILRPMLFRYDLSPSSLPSLSMNIKTFEERREAGLKIKGHYFQDDIMDGSSEEILRVRKLSNIYSVQLLDFFVSM